jgi:hypothetical protein
MDRCEGRSRSLQDSRPKRDRHRTEQEDKTLAEQLADPITDITLAEQLAEPIEVAWSNCSFHRSNILDGSSEQLWKFLTLLCLEGENPNRDRSYSIGSIQEDYHLHEEEGFTSYLRLPVKPFPGTVTVAE